MNYIKLLIMTVLSWISMYILMYLMVDSFANVYLNLNQFYMATAMTMPMVIFELFLMRSMYQKKFLNNFLIIISFIVMVISIFFIRKQTAIGSREFLKSMIPHHAGAILMSEQADIDDPEVSKLRDAILESQKAEIAFMKAKLKDVKTKYTLK